ncbi:MAG TPA: hypothetical protein VMJ10_07780 [Kofleriaceae bacterium]|nr:hypothetical protein [Kofleriaceae bacterium]
MSNNQDPFASIDSQDLANVSGGTTSVASGSSTDANDQMMFMLQQIGQSIQDLAQNNNGGNDQMMQMMMMMMMMGGMGGGAAASPYPYAQPPTYVQVSGNGCGGKGF